jgi:hypothetical protein
MCGLSGVWIGGKPIVIHIAGRISGSDSIDNEMFFRSFIILLVSLVLLILVHFGHILCDVWGIKEGNRNPKGKLTNLSGTPWEPKSKMVKDDNTRRTTERD